MPAEAIERLEAALGEAAGAEVVLERPGDPTHGDYATNAAMRLAGARKQPPRAIAEQLVELAAALPDVDRAEIAGPGFVNLWLTLRGTATRSPRSSRPGKEYGSGSARQRKSVQVEMVSANPTGPITVAPARNGAYGDSRRPAARVRRATRSSASTTTTTPAHRWSSSAPRSRHAGAARSRPRTATRATTSPSSRRCPTTRSRRCCSGSRRRSSASGSTSTRGRSRASSRSGSPST